LVVATKVEDETGRARAQELANAIGQPVLAISSATGRGLNELVAAIWSVLATLPRRPGAD
jgi:predicted GTPase